MRAAMMAGGRKMPLPMVTPATTATAAARSPSSAAAALRQSRDGLAALGLHFFSALASLRKRLNTPATFAKAAAGLRKAAATFGPEAVAVFVFGAITDAFDGLIARYYKQRTALGAILDPLADKLLTATVFLGLAFNSKRLALFKSGEGLIDTGNFRDQLFLAHVGGRSVCCDDFNCHFQKGCHYFLLVDQ